MMNKKSRAIISFCNLLVCASAAVMRYSIPYENRNIVSSIAYIALMTALLVSYYFINKSE